MLITLDRLRPGMGATVVRVDAQDALRRRLSDFALVPGTYVRCSYRTAHVSALSFRGSVVALRSRDLARITGIV